MKILAIRGKNLASLEAEFNIDFSVEPLHSAGIFAITGQTGAGKSTILDALCIALFDNAPRLNKAENVKREDIENTPDKITFQDSRNILRRGASEGYAEVEFIALNGDRYRSRWTVRRARGKADGALQPAIIKLDNLSAGVEEPGTKSNLLVRISELIGLTFDQFTRAVLLAQGDFANFLKAKSNEKAEILEKHTGTEVYTKISATIYQKTAEAKTSFEAIQQRVKDVKLIPTEELEIIEQEKASLGKELVSLKSEKQLIEKKIAWIKQEEEIKQDIAQADETLKLVQQTMQENLPRYEYLSKVDATQEIRDIYVDLESKINRQAKLTVELKEKKERLTVTTDQLVKLSSELELAKTTLSNSEQKYEALKPELSQAKELDRKIQSLQEKQIELNKELGSYKKSLSDSDQSIAIFIEQQREAQETKGTLSTWFADNEVYENIVSRIDLIDSLIKNAQSSKEQQTNALKGFESSKSMLKTYTETLNQQEAEAEHLNNLLPTEVINLRNQLREREPCPVCGSTHHPLNDIVNQAQVVNEQELESAKQNNQKALAQTKEHIEKTKTSITEFETHAKSFQVQYESAYHGLQEHLKLLPDWEVKFKNKTLQKELAAINTQWNQNKKQLDGDTLLLENLNAKIESEQKSRVTILQSIADKEDALKLHEAILNENIDQRSKLLDGKSTDEIEKFYSAQSLEFSRKVEELRTSNGKLEEQKALLLGTTEQIEKDTKANEEAIAELRATIDTWISSNKYQITLGLLKDIIAKDTEWISNEKQYLTAIREQGIIAKTTLEERKNRLQKHLESKDKPDSTETIDILSQHLVAISQRIDTITKRDTEIEVQLLSHKDAEKQFKAFEKELNEKSQLYESWAKLNDLLGSARGDKFKSIAQSYTLEVLLSYANRHLEDLTKRYRLEKISDTLALQVVDNDMLGEVRPVHSLSGGESFLISLALALGLSSLSSNRMKIESLFIDEGFGALDIDTLSIAMDALDNLQTQGRKIGVISHVEEMKERITTQIQVVKSANGRSHIKIVG